MAVIKHNAINKNTISLIISYLWLAVLLMNGLLIGCERNNDTTENLSAEENYR